jgi:hypothetical protein
MSYDPDVTPEPAPPAPTQSAPESSPPRAFTQGVGTVFQFAGVTLFLGMMFVCCSSGLLSSRTAVRHDLTHVGWHLPGDAADAPWYSAQRALAVSVPAGVFFGVALASIGLGLQATRRPAPWLAVAVTILGLAFWLVQTIFVLQFLHSRVLVAVGCILTGMFAALLGLSGASLHEMLKDPPPTGYEVLPKDFKVPYSHLHADPPEVRLAKELEERRHRLEVQQKELQALEERIRRQQETYGNRDNQ